MRKIMAAAIPKTIASLRRSGAKVAVAIPMTMALSLESTSLTRRTMENIVGSSCRDEN
jgi:hypothetical protein